MRTSMRAESVDRDKPVRIAKRDHGGTDLDETVARLAFEHESFTALARLSDDALQEYQEEQRDLAESDMPVPE
ncbi:hypothetical protein CDG81_18770 [Actinopolyspora erythraea]|nr:hypothetical protein [Actinopolyspora erythraea]ASU79966.1 hypothetical protein CDG81_18770 [Actinopolyspora erythraea]